VKILVNIMGHVSGEYEPPMSRASESLSVTHVGIGRSG